MHALLFPEFVNYSVKYFAQLRRWRIEYFSSLLGRGFILVCVLELRRQNAVCVISDV
jgi:hypothetical protein